MPGEKLKQALASGHGGRWELEFPTKYVRGADLKSRDATVTISDIEPGHELKGSNGEKDTGLVLYFAETKKMMVVNKTNAKTIAGMYGNELTEWIGKRITLYPEHVSAFGSMHEAIRVRPKKPAAKVQAVRQAVRQEEPAHDQDTGEVFEEPAESPVAHEEVGL